MSKNDIFKQLDKADGSNDRRTEYARLQVLLLAELLEEMKKDKVVVTLPEIPSSPTTPEVIRANKMGKKKS